jgi:hypothetical protein
MPQDIDVTSSSSASDNETVSAEIKTPRRILDYLNGDTKLSRRGSFRDVISMSYDESNNLQQKQNENFIALKDYIYNEDSSTGEDSQDDSGGDGTGRPSEVSASDWAIVKRYSDQEGTDPYLVIAIGVAETGWGKTGMGKHGYHLGFGVMDSKVLPEFQGLDAQVKEVTARLKVLGDCAGHMLGEKMNTTLVDYGGMTGPEDLVWVQCGAKPGGQLNTGKGVAGKRPWSRANGVYGYRTTSRKNWYKNAKTKYLELKSGKGLVDDPAVAGSGRSMAPAEAQKFYNELVKISKEGEYISVAKRELGDISRGIIALPLVQIMLYLAMVKQIKIGYTCLVSGHDPQVHGKSVISRHKYGLGCDMSTVGGTHIHTGIASGIQRAKAICDALAGLNLSRSEFGSPPQLHTYMHSKKSNIGNIFTDSGHNDHIHFGISRKYAPKGYMSSTFAPGYSPSTAGTGFYNSLIWDTFRDYEKAIGRVAQSRTTRTS